MRNCHYDGRCREPRAYRVTEKAIGARAEQVVYCCARHYPGNKVAPPPTERRDTPFYIIEPLSDR